MGCQELGTGDGVTEGGEGVDEVGVVCGRVPGVVDDNQDGEEFWEVVCEGAHGCSVGVDRWAVSVVDSARCGCIVDVFLEFSFFLFVGYKSSRGIVETMCAVLGKAGEEL